MQEMLSALDYGGPAGFLRDVKDALHTQEIWAEILLQRFEQEAQRLTRNGLFADEAEGSDIAVVQAMVPAGMIAIVMLAMTVTFVSLNIQPSAWISARIRGIEPLRTQ